MRALSQLPLALVWSHSSLGPSSLTWKGRGCVRRPPEALRALTCQPPCCAGDKGVAQAGCDLLLSRPAVHLHGTPGTLPGF